MNTFDTFSRPERWASAATAFAADFATGARIQVAPWGGYAILGHAQLVTLGRNPRADGMAPDPATMADTPVLLSLLERALFTKAGEVHRAERAALIAGFERVPLSAVVQDALKAVLPAGPTVLDTRTGLIDPFVRRVWGEILGLDEARILWLSQAVDDLAPALNPAGGSGDPAVTDAAAGRVRDLSAAAIDGPAPLPRALAARLGCDLAADLIAGMAFDAIDSAAAGLDSALRVAFAHRPLIRPTARCAEECLRLAAPTPMTMRLTTDRIVLDDLELAPGTVLSMIWAAGNHDPAAFPDPARFDPNRTGARPLTFGLGPHACLGHAIIRSALAGLLGVLEAMHPVDDTGAGGWHPFAPLPKLDIRCRFGG